MCCPEHMCRTGPAFSPSRASRAAVRRSSGAPSDPQASNAWLTPERRYRPWSVRTWRSSPECELAMIASSAGSRSKAAIPPASMSASSPNGLTVERRVTTRSGSPSCADDPAGGVGLDDVAAMDALLDAVRGAGARGSAATIRPRRPRASPGAPRPGGRRRHGGSGHGARIYRVMRVRRRRSMGRGYPADRSEASHATAPNLHVSQHPAVLHKLAILRDEQTEPKKFREVVRELSWLLGLRGARRRPRPPARDPDAARADDRRTSSASASASCRSCGPAWAWSTRCSS